MSQPTVCTQPKATPPAQHCKFNRWNMFILPESSAESCQTSKSEELRFQNLFQIHSEYTFTTFYNCSYGRCLKDEMNAVRAMALSVSSVSSVSKFCGATGTGLFLAHPHDNGDHRTCCQNQCQASGSSGCRLVSSCFKHDNWTTDTYRYTNGTLNLQPPSWSI